MLYICFAAYNEEPNIQPMVANIAAALDAAEYKIIAYNDGSSDKTLDELNAANLTVLSSPQNHGLGYGMNQLISYLVKNAGDNDIAVFMDGDNTHDPVVIKDMLIALQNHDVAIASRFTPQSVSTGISLFRWMISFAARVVWRCVLNEKNVKDYTSGYRGYKLSKLKQAQVAGKEFVTLSGFECQIEILYKLKKAGASFVEVPIKMHYEQKQGASKLKITRTIWRHYRLARKILSGQI